MTIYSLNESSWMQFSWAEKSLHFNWGRTLIEEGDEALAEVAGLAELAELAVEIN